MSKLEQARHELLLAMTELAVVQEALAVPRMRWRGVWDGIASECVPGRCERTGEMLWRSLGWENIALLNSERAKFVEATRDLIPIERSLKEAVRVARIDLDRAEKEASKSPNEHRRSEPKGARPAAQGDLFA